MYVGRIRLEINYIHHARQKLYHSFHQILLQGKGEGDKTEIILTGRVDACLYLSRKGLVLTFFSFGTCLSAGLMSLPSPAHGTKVNDASKLHIWDALWSSESSTIDPNCDSSCLGLLKLVTLNTHLFPKHKSQSPTSYMWLYVSPPQKGGRLQMCQ